MPTTTQTATKRSKNLGGFLQINEFLPSTCNKLKPQGRFLKITRFYIIRIRANFVYLKLSFGYNI